MPSNNPDLNNNAPDSSAVALVIIDMINDLEFPGGDELLGPAKEVAERIASLKRKASEAGIPVIYANDNFGRWRSDFRETVQRCFGSHVRGKPLVQMLEPDPDDYFVIKPKHSAFYATPLELLLQHLGCKRLILVGITGDMCVHFTAIDGYVRDYELYIPPDCTASINEASNRQTLAYAKSTLKAELTPSAELDLHRLKHRT